MQRKVMRDGFFYRLKTTLADHSIVTDWSQAREILELEALIMRRNGLQVELQVRSGMLALAVDF